MTTPALFVGARSGTALLQVEVGATDNGSVFPFTAKTNRYAPAGAGGEAIFTTIYLTTSHQAAVTLRVTPLIDGVALTPTSIFLSAQVSRVSQVKELPLSLPYLLGGEEQGRFAPRGAWCEVLVETTDGPSEVLVEQVEIEYEVVRESKS